MAFFLKMSTTYILFLFFLLFGNTKFEDHQSTLPIELYRIKTQRTEIRNELLKAYFVFLF